MTATVVDMATDLARSRRAAPTPWRAGDAEPARRSAELAHERDDVTAQELWGRLRQREPTTGLATVYRTLALLSDAGVVDALSHHAGASSAIGCAARAHHHHLVCERCHRVVEVEKCDLDGWVNKAAEAARLRRHRPPRRDQRDLLRLPARVGSPGACRRPSRRCLHPLRLRDRRDEDDDVTVTRTVTTASGPKKPPAAEAETAYVKYFGIPVKPVTKLDGRCRRPARKPLPATCSRSSRSSSSSA